MKDSAQATFARRSSSWFTALGIFQAEIAPTPVIDRLSWFDVMLTRFTVRRLWCVIGASSFLCHGQILSPGADNLQYSLGGTR